MSFEIISLVCPPIETNSYLVFDPVSKDAVVIDAGFSSFDFFSKMISEKGLSLHAILLTHGHFDHVAEAALFQNKKIKLYGHPQDLFLFEHPIALSMPSIQIAPLAIDQFLKEGERLEFGTLSFEVVHTPGHSAGSVCYAIKGTFFSGDTLFEGTYGRVDLPGGSAKQMRQSLALLFNLPDSTPLFPGHGPSCLLGAQKSWMKRIVRT